jgi:Protein-tyrosine phosphatase
MFIEFSAGVGRTGTFIALDIMIQRIKQEKKINIFDLVKQLREQRIKMVQTIDQYAFLYTSAMELLESRRQQPQGKKTKYLKEKNSYSFFPRSLSEHIYVLRRVKAFQAIEEGSERK